VLSIFDQHEKKALVFLLTLWKELLTALRERPIPSMEFECKARILGIVSIAVLGTKVITPSFAQLIFYMPYYVRRAEEIALETGIPISIVDIDDGIFEQSHQDAKNGIFLDSRHFTFLFLMSFSLPFSFFFYFFLFLFLFLFFFLVSVKPSGEISGIRSPEEEGLEWEKSILAQQVSQMFLLIKYKHKYPSKKMRTPPAHLVSVDLEGSYLKGSEDQNKPQASEDSEEESEDEDFDDDIEFASEMDEESEGEEDYEEVEDGVEFGLPPATKIPKRKKRKSYDRV